MMITLLGAIAYLCPGAVIDQAKYERSIGGVPVYVQVLAHKALGKCRREGKAVPATVSEFNDHRHELIRVEDVVRDLHLEPPVER